MTATLLVLLVFPMAMAFAAASDLLTMRISNKVSLVLVAGFIAAALLTGQPLNEVGWHLAAAGLVAEEIGRLAGGVLTGDVLARVISAEASSTAAGGP
ncbi:MAG: hypothetical protein HC829_01765 [Bacteroidales bacterium]|nr:hypothetical protein [Bacteroidales bacterium]